MGWLLHWLCYWWRALFRVQRAGLCSPYRRPSSLNAFRPETQGAALGLYALGVVFAPVIGPAFGGYLTDAISWRWAFYINVPVGAAALLMQAKFLEDPLYYKTVKPGKLDGWGLGLLGLWVGSLQFVLDKGQEDNWFGNNRIHLSAVVFVVSFILFLLHEFRSSKPLVDLRAFKNRNLSIGCISVFALGIVLYGLTSELPVFYQTLLG